MWGARRGAGWGGANVDRLAWLPVESGRGAGLFLGKWGRGVEWGGDGIEDQLRAHALEFASKADGLGDMVEDFAAEAGEE